MTGEEFLSRFRRGDKIYPVITLVFYYDVKKWDGAVNLYGMFPEMQDGEMKDVLHKFRSSIWWMPGRLSEWSTFAQIYNRYLAC